MTTCAFINSCNLSGSEEGLQPVVNSLPRILFTFLIAGAAILYRLQPLWRENPNAMVLAMWNSTVGTNGMVQKVPCPENQKVEYSGEWNLIAGLVE